MSIEIRSFETIPDAPALEGLLTSYYQIMSGKMIRAGGPEVAQGSIMAGLWDGMGAFGGFTNEVQIL